MLLPLVVVSVRGQPVTPMFHGTNS
jgi:hypothetical protein